MKTRKIVSHSANSPRSERVINAILAETAKKLSSKRGKFKANITKPKRQLRSINYPEQGTKLKAEESASENETMKEQKQVIFPHISKDNWSKFEAKLSGDTLDEVTKKLNSCLARMHGHERRDTHFTSLHFVRLAIVDSLSNRRWDNLVQLVIMLGRNYSDPMFTMLIRHLCGILKHYHPAIKGTKFEDQLELIVDKFDKKRNK